MLANFFDQFAAFFFFCLPSFILPLISFWILSLIYPISIALFFAYSCSSIDSSAFLVLPFSLQSILISVAFLLIYHAIPYYYYYFLNIIIQIIIIIIQIIIIIIQTIIQIIIIHLITNQYLLNFDLFLVHFDNQFVLTIIIIDSFLILFSSFMFA